MHCFAMHARPAVRLFPFLLYLMYVFMTPPTADDVWWRLHSGREILHQGRIIDANDWAYRDAGQPWVNHAAGYDAILALSGRAFGMTGVVSLHFLAALLLAALLLRPTQRGDFAWALFLVPLLAVHHALRPFVFSDVLLYAAVALSVRAHDRDELRIRDLWPSYLLFGVWGQLHGAVWIGLAVFGLLGVRWRSLWTAPVREVRRAAPLALAFPCALANPAFFSGLRLAWRYAVASPAWLSRLSEWQAPGPPALFCVGAFAGGLLWAAQRRGLPLGRLAPLAFLLPSAFTQVRHLPLPAIAAVALLLTLRPAPFPLPPGLALKKPAFWAVLLVPAALAAALVQVRHLEDPRFVPPGLYAQMARRCRLDHGNLRIFTHHAWGGSLIYHFKGRLLPYMDARNDCFSQETFDRYDDIEHLRGDWYGKLMEDHPDGAVLRGDHPLVPELLRRGWVPGARWRYNRFLVAPHRSRTLCRRIPGGAGAGRR